LLLVTPAALSALDLSGHLLTGSDRDNWTAPVMLVGEMGQFVTSRGLSVGITTPLAVIIVALIPLAALQIFYLDRLAITSDRSATADAPAVSAPPRTGTRSPPPMIGAKVVLQAPMIGRSLRGQ
jgi:hypothetical protein